jgi:hypothetical protein
LTSLTFIGLTNKVFLLDLEACEVKLPTLSTIILCMLSTQTKLFRLSLENFCESSLESFKSFSRDIFFLTSIDISEFKELIKACVSDNLITKDSFSCATSLSFKGNLMMMSQFNKFPKKLVIGHLKVNLLIRIHGKGLKSIHNKGVKDLTQEFNPNRVNPLLYQLKNQ